MGGTYNVTVGNKGRIVIPADLRARHAWVEGTPLIAVETERGMALVARGDARALIAQQLAGHDLVADLIRSRRAEAADDAA